MQSSTIKLAHVWALGYNYMVRMETIKFRNKARTLRSEGKTYSEIMSILGIRLPKSTISDWCSNVPLPSWYTEKILKINNKNFNKAQKMAWASNKIKRERLLKNLLDNIEHLKHRIKDRDILKMLLAMLYLGEGSKWKYHSGLMLGSSDPEIINLYIKLLNICYDISTEKLHCRVSYRADQNIKRLEKYWSKITSIPLKNFYKTIPDPRTVGKPTKNKDYKGVCVITCAGTHIQLELEAIPKLVLKGL